MRATFLLNHQKINLAKLKSQVAKLISGLIQDRDSVVTLCGQNEHYSWIWHFNSYFKHQFGPLSIYPAAALSDILLEIISGKENTEIYAIACGLFVPRGRHIGSACRKSKLLLYVLFIAWQLLTMTYDRLLRNMDIFNMCVS